MNYFVIVFSVLIALMRFVFRGHPVSLPLTLDALDHIWVGFLIGVAFVESHRRIALIALIVLTLAIEAPLFLLGR
jgi:hypothetical protein